MFDADKTRMIGLPYGENTMTIVSRFHLIRERYGRTDGRTDRQICYINIARQYADEYTCWSQQSISTNSAAILRMEIKHVAAYYFLRTIMGRVDLGFVRQSSRNVALCVEQPSVLNKFFFSELQYSAAFGRESRKFAGRIWKYAEFRHFLAHPVV